MALDKNGYIRILEILPYQSEFQQLITESVNRLRALLDKDLHSIYIYGSVAKGQAVPYKSDIDFCVIINQPINLSTYQPISQMKASYLVQLQEALASDYQVVSKVDFDIGTYSEVTDRANLYSWGY